MWYLYMTLGCKGLSGMELQPHEYKECTLYGKCISDVITTQHLTVSALLTKRHSGITLMSTTNYAHVVNIAAAYNSRLSIFLI